MTDSTAPTLTDEQREQIRNGAFGAIAWVSRADPGFLSMFRESMAGSTELAAAPAAVRELLAGTGGLPKPPTGSAEEVETRVLADLQSAMTALRAVAPGQAEGYREVVLAACATVAEAADGVAPAEQAVIDKVRAALQG